MEKEAINLKGSKKGYTGGLGGRRGKAEMLIIIIIFIISKNEKKRRNHCL